MSAATNGPAHARKPHLRSDSGSTNRSRWSRTGCRRPATVGSKSGAARMANMFCDQGADRAIGAQPDQRRQLRHHRAETGKCVSQFAEADVEIRRRLPQIRNRPSRAQNGRSPRASAPSRHHSRSYARRGNNSDTTGSMARRSGGRGDFLEQLEQLFEQKRRRDHRRTSVMAKAIAFKNLCPAAKLVEAFDQGHMVAHGTAANAAAGHRPPPMTTLRGAEASPAPSAPGAI